ncbi:MAG: ferrous iron transport protein A [Treponema sp.]|jgi:ferrous iron transport protein A|nr:ferrous iron transport protein A [Treponema sp.]
MDFLGIISYREVTLLEKNNRFLRGRYVLMPLALVKPGEVNSIKKIGGRDDIKKRLETLGFIVGGVVTVVSEINGNMIVHVKDSRIAISREMANKIMV